MYNSIGEARLSVRGQLAVPKKVKERLNAEYGDFIVFYEENGRIYIKAAVLRTKEQQ